MIKRIRAAACLAAILTVFPLTGFADYEAGEAANRRGDRAAAFAAFQQAARQGDARAFGKLGSMYLYGLGTDRDYVKAYVWFALAEEHGDRLAERFRMTAAATLTRAQIEQARELTEEKRRELAFRQLPAID